jgi:UPF0176 protein
MSKYTIIALYKFCAFQDFKAFQPNLYTFCSSLGIKGTLLLASEGINGTLCGSDDAITAFIHFLTSDARFADLDYKLSYTEQMAFFRLKIKLKKEIVTMGVPTVNPVEKTGIHLSAKAWNALLSDPDVILLDTRNRYETAIGHFKNAVDPQTHSFREFPEYVNKNLGQYKNKKIAMYCTGGIRCEKASSYLLQQGFKNVYQLKGGILKYMEETTAQDSLWEGECFIFDNRVAVDHALNKGNYDQCFGCRHPITEEDKQTGYYLKGVYCPRCHDTRSEKQKNSAAERQKQIDLAKKRGELHIR